MEIKSFQRNNRFIDTKIETWLKWVKIRNLVIYNGTHHNKSETKLKNNHRIDLNTPKFQEHADINQLQDYECFLIQNDSWQ